MTTVALPPYMTSMPSPALSSPDPNAWGTYSWSEPLPSPPLSIHSMDGLDPALVRHAAATAFQRDMYALRTKTQHAKIPEELGPAIEVLDVSRLIARPENLNIKAEFPVGVKHLCLKNTQIDITASLRAASKVESVTLFVDMTWGRTTVAQAPLDANELVLNITYPPQRACRLDATPKFAAGHVTVLLHPSFPTSHGPHKMLLGDIQSLIAAVALQKQNQKQRSGVVATLVCDSLSALGHLKWEMPGRGGSEATRKYLLACAAAQVDPNAAVEVIDLATYRARVGEEVFARSTVW